MTGLIMAWLVGEGIVSYRAVHNLHRAPLPSEILATSGFFVLAALLAQENRTLGTLLAWGVDAAAFLNLYSTPGTAKSLAKAEGTARSVSNQLNGAKK